MTHLAHAPSLRQPADLLGRDMAALTSKLAQKIEAVGRVKSKKRTQAAKKEVAALKARRRMIVDEQGRLNKWLPLPIEFFTERSAT